MNSASSIVTASECRLVQGRSFHRSYCDIAVSGGASNEDLSFFEDVEPRSGQKLVSGTNSGAKPRES